MPSVPLEIGFTPVVLDTHVWIWLMEGVAGELGRHTVGLIDEASRRGRVLVSPISMWEAGMLESKGRVRFSMELRAWVRKALAAPGVHVANLTPEVALDAARLPAPVHGDPADRMLIATARLAGASLVTRDAAILEYARLGHVLAENAAT